MSDEKIAPLLVGAGRVAMGAAKNPKVQSAVGNAVGRMVAGKEDPNDPNQANKAHAKASSAFDQAWSFLKSAMAPADDEEEDEEDWDDTDPTTTGISSERFNDESQRPPGVIPRAKTNREPKRNPFEGYLPDPTNDRQGLNPSNPKKLDFSGLPFWNEKGPAPPSKFFPNLEPINPRDVEEDTEGLEIDLDDPDWNKGGSRIADYFTASSDKAFVDAWSIVKQIA